MNDAQDAEDLARYLIKQANALRIPHVLVRLVCVQVIKLLDHAPGTGHQEPGP